jgi:hypothetical protein
MKKAYDGRPPEEREGNPPLWSPTPEVKGLSRREVADKLVSQTPCDIWDPNSVASAMLKSSVSTWLWKGIKDGYFPLVSTPLIFKIFLFNNFSTQSR